MTKVGRYEVRSKLGEGGMGVVFRAYDPKPLDREVAIKTLHEFTDNYARELFFKECAALKSISHPNIVEIFDMGEYDEGGHKRPFFVMPLLAGQTLEELIRKASHRLTVDRVVEIFAQTCRGLQAAHDRGLIHRDIKPTNIFVMADDSVKLIDFGVAHSTSEMSRSGYGKGTLIYMSPEQVQHKPVTVQSDIYALGVTLYEALTRRQPFRTSTEESIIQAILSQIPPPASDLNPSVTHVVSRVVHKAMAKRPWNRFDSAREFGDTLQKAYRNEPIALFDPARTQPRIQTASKALEKGDFQFAGEIVAELEEEGSIDPQLRLLRAQIDQIARQKTVAQLLESARARFEEQEDPLALQKIQEILHLDPTNVGALGLKSKIEARRSDRQIEQWLQLAQQHVSNKSYAHARDALQHALGLRPKDSRAVRLLKEIETEEQDYVRLRREKSDLYQAAVNAWQNGEVSQALSQMKHVLELDRRAPDDSSPEASNAYQIFYDKIRSEHEAMNAAYADARRHLAEREYGRAVAICDQFLAKYPGQALFQALKFDIEGHQRQSLSAFIADVDRQLDAESDLEARLSLVREAAEQFPDEDHFRRLVRLHQDKRDLVNSIVERAKVHEAAGQITEALSDLETLGTIYTGYPGLAFEKERLTRRLEQQTREAARARRVRQIDNQMQTGDHVRALELLDEVETEYPNDDEFAELRRQAQAGVDRMQRAEELVAEGQRLCLAGEFEKGVNCLRSALKLDDRSSARTSLRDVLVTKAQADFDTSWRDAETLIDQALDLDPHHPLARSLKAQAIDRRRDETVPAAAMLARRLQAEGRFDEAMAEVNKVLAVYSNDSRLVVIADALKKERERTAPTEPTVAPTAAADVTRSGALVTQARSAASEQPTAVTPISPAEEVTRLSARPVVPVVWTESPSRRWTPIAVVAAVVLGVVAWAVFVRGGGTPTDQAATIVATKASQTPAPAQPPSASPLPPASASTPTAAPAEPVSTPRGLPGTAATAPSTPPPGPPQPARASGGASASPIATQAAAAAVAPATNTAAATARLNLTDWPAGVIVIAGGRRLGQISANGTLTDDMPPGRQALRFQRADYEDLTLDADFVAGQLVTVSGSGRTWRALAAAPPSAAVSSSALVTVRMRTDPDVQVKISREDGGSAQSFQGPRDLQLAPGNYRVEAIGRDKIPMPSPVTLRVEPGSAREYDIPYVRGMWAMQSNQWMADGGDWIKLLTRQAMLDVPQVMGRVYFTVKVKDNYFNSGPFQSGAPLTWVYGYENDQNYFAVSLTATDVHIQRKVNGALTVLQKVPHQFVQKINTEYATLDGVEFSIDLGSGAPVHRYRLIPKFAKPTDWKPLPGDYPRAPAGRFGFIATQPNALVIKRDFRFVPSVR